MKKNLNDSLLIESIASSMGRMFEYDGYAEVAEARKRSVVSPEELEEPEEDELLAGKRDEYTEEPEDDLDSTESLDDGQPQDSTEGVAPEDEDIVGDEQDAATQDAPTSKPVEGEDEIEGNDEENPVAFGKFGIEKEESDEEKNQISLGNSIARKLHKYENKWGDPVDFQSLTDETIEAHKANAQSMLKEDPNDASGKMEASLAKDLESIKISMDEYKAKYGYDFDEATHDQMKQDYIERHNGHAEEEEEEREKEYRKSAVFPANTVRNPGQKVATYDRETAPLIRQAWNDEQGRRSQGLIFYKVIDHYGAKENGKSPEQMGMIPTFASTLLRTGSFKLPYNDDVIDAIALCFGRLADSDTQSSPFPEVTEAGKNVERFLYNTVLSNNSMNPESYSMEDHVEAKQLTNELKIQVFTTLQDIKEEGNGNFLEGLKHYVSMDDLTAEVESLRSSPGFANADKIKRLSMVNAWQRDPLGSAEEILKAAIYEDNPDAKRIARSRGWRIPQGTSLGKFKGLGVERGSVLDKAMGHENRLNDMRHSYIPMDDAMRSEIDTEEAGDEESINTSQIPEGISKIVRGLIETLPSAQFKAKFNTGNPLDMYLGPFNAKLFGSPRGLMVQRIMDLFPGGTNRRAIGVRYAEALKTALQPIVDKFVETIKDPGKEAVDMNNPEAEDIKWVKKFQAEGRAPDEEEDEEDEDGNIIHHAYVYRNKTPSEVMQYAALQLSTFFSMGGLQNAYKSNPELAKAVDIINRIEKTGMVDNPVRTSKGRLNLATKWKDAVEAQRAGRAEDADSIAQGMVDARDERFGNALKRHLTKMRTNPEANVTDDEQDEMMPESFNGYERMFSKLYQGIFE